MRNKNGQKIKNTLKTPKADPAVRALRKKVQHGVTLVELTIVLVIIGIIIAVLYTQIGGSDTDRVRANSLYQHAKLVALAADSQQQLLGCYALDARGLFEQVNFTVSGGNSCGTNPQLSTPFSGPYIKGVVTDGDNGIRLDDIAVGARGNITIAAGADPVLGTNVYYELSGVNNIVAGLIYQACSKSVEIVVDLPTGATESEPCIYSEADSGNTFGYFIGNYTP